MMEIEHRNWYYHFIILSYFCPIKVVTWCNLGIEVRYLEKGIKTNLTHDTQQIEIIKFHDESQRDNLQQHGE